MHEHDNIDLGTRLLQILALAFTLLLAAGLYQTLAAGEFNKTGNAVFELELESANLREQREAIIEQYDYEERGEAALWDAPAGWYRQGAEDAGAGREERYWLKLE